MRGKVAELSLDVLPCEFICASPLKVNALRIGVGTCYEAPPSEVTIGCV